MDSSRIIADIRQMTASISKEETTATPTAARALQEARGHLLRAYMAVERAQRSTGRTGAGT